MNDKDEEKNVKSYKKLINFYKIYITPSFRVSGKDNATILYEHFYEIFKNNEEYSISDVTFKVITLDKNHIFASICRQSDLDVLTEIKNSKGENLDDPEIFLENYTYFYIDFKEEGMSVLKTKNIPIVKDYISELIESNDLINVDVEPFKKSDEEIKKLNINKISMTFCDNSDGFVELNHINMDDCEIGEYKFEAKLKKVGKNFVKDMVNNFKGSKNVKKISASTDTEEIDLIRNIFTKQVSIELNKDYKNDFDKFEETLRDELFKIINR